MLVAGKGVLEFAEHHSMGLPRRKFLHLAAGAAAFPSLTRVASALDYPTRPLTLVVPFAAGGPSDVAGRVIAQRMSEVFGKPVVVENLSGAGGTVGSAHVAKAVPDGYQFVLGNSGTHVWSQSLYKRPPYNTITDFTPVSLVVESPRTLITPKTFPANSLPEFIAYVKANQTTVKYGSAGAGSASHVSCVLFNAAIGINVTHVPYRGLAPAMQDLTAGRVDYLCDSPSTTLPQIKGDFVKVLATTGLKRAAALPQVPTVLEQGLPFDVTTWQAIFLPKDTPDAIVQRLNQVIGETLDTPSVHERFTTIGEEVTAPQRRGPEYLIKFIASEIERWSGPIRASGATMD
jgi:tripartite-type tricarboxylate transporter receptor subunit TctC